jgi:DNA-binding protein H-NS
MIKTEKEFNITTGEETITEREETAAELKGRKEAEAEAIAAQAEAESKAIAKAELLAKLGITADEAALLLS